MEAWWVAITVCPDCAVKQGGVRLANKMVSFTRTHVVAFTCTVCRREFVDRRVADQAAGARKMTGICTCRCGCSKKLDAVGALCAACVEHM